MRQKLQLQSIKSEHFVKQSSDKSFKLNKDATANLNEEAVWKDY